MLDLIAGTCAIETEDTTLRTAEHLAIITQDLGINLIYKGSFDKANRTSINSPRGVGIDEGLRILEKVREQFDVLVLTDIHDVTQIPAVADAVDVLQTPAFLCRQTDFIQAVCKTHKPVSLQRSESFSNGCAADLQLLCNPILVELFARFEMPVGNGLS